MNPSLLLIPDRYKASKLYSQIPDSGAGDLAFTRANDTATRVNSAGLIEKVRTNLQTYSQDFSNAVWVKSAGATLTHTQTDPNGGTTASRLQMPSGTSNFLAASAISGLTNGGKYTHSVFMKSNTGSTQSVRILDGVRGVAGGTLTASVTTSWQRFDVAITTASTSAGIQIDNQGGTFQNDILIAFAQTEDSDFGATPYIPTTTAAVSVGPVANIPRIDYTGGGCGKLLLEPQRTNLFNFSEQLDNAYWSKIGSITITANNAISPDGFQNADLVTTTATSRIQRAFTGLTAGTRTLSCFAKAGSSNLMRINSFDGTADRDAEFNLATGQVVATGSGVTATITPYGNGWYRITHTRTSANTTYSCQFFFDTAGTWQVWGMQFEDQSSYPTSYIPTLGASVTRSADAASKTGISSLIGQTSGTIFIEVDAKVFSQMPISSEHRITMVSDNTNNNRILVDFIVTSGGVRRIGVNVISGNASQANLIFNTAIDKVYKIATAYNTNDFTLFVDGVERATDVSGVTFSGTTLSRLDVGQDRVGTLQQSNPIVAAAVYPTRLSNAELATLTTL